MRVSSLYEFYEEKHRRVLDRYWDYDKMKCMAKTLKKRMPMKPIYVLFEGSSEEEANNFRKKLIELGAIEIEPFPQATYVLEEDREREVRNIFEGFCGTIVVDKSGGLPAFLFYSRYNWTRLKLILGSFQTKGMVLDVGCGEGYIAVSLARKGNGVVGLDISPTRLDRVKVLAKKKGVDVYLVVGDAQNLPFKNKCFNYAVCAEILDHVPDDKKALREVARILNKGCLVLDSQLHLSSLFSSQSVDTLPDKDGHCHKYSLLSLKKLLTQAGLKIDKIEGVGEQIGFLLNPTESWPGTYVGRLLWDFLYWFGRELPFISSTVVVKASLRV